MSLKQAYLLEIERETANTRRMLAGIKDEHLAYQPHPKSMNLGDLAAHVVELHNWVNLVLSRDKFNFHTDYQRPVYTTAQDIQNSLDEQEKSNIAQIESMSDEDWMSMWSLVAGEHVIASMPKVGAMRYIIQNHLIHHRGQLSVYLRLNDIPVPGIYGPSADEQ